MPLDDHDAFELWLRERWYEKDALMEEFVSTGRFPVNKAEIKGSVNGALKADFIETEVKLRGWWEVGNIFVILATFGLVVNLFAKMCNVLLYGRQS